MHLTTIANLTKEDILKLIKKALFFKKSKDNFPLVNKAVANIFLEPSTRTLVSFQKAQQNLKMETYNLQVKESSFIKGETLEDTLLNLKAIGINNFVIRTTKEAYWQNIKIDNISIINGGDGRKNHPSQSLLDALTIFEEFQTLSNLKVLICGDTKNSRVFHSLKELFSKFNSQVDSTGPKTLGKNHQNLNDILPIYDVVVMLRIQHERHEKKFDTKNYNQNFGLNEKNVLLLKNKAIFLHPGPVNQNVEISSSVVFKNAKSRILKQVENGVFMRMAILEQWCKNI